MNIAILSDIHGNIQALNSVISDIKSFDVSDILFLGDLIINGPAPLEVYQEMCKLSPSCWVLGNTDTWFIEINVNWNPSSDYEDILYQKYKFACKYLKDSFIDHLIRRPEKCSLEIEGISLLSVHGSPRSYSEGILENTPDEELEDMFSEIKEKIILCGHTHIPLVKKFGNKTIFNVGSVGFPVDNDNRATYGIINITDTSPKFKIRRVKYPIDKIIALAEERGFPGLKEYSRILTEGKI